MCPVPAEACAPAPSLFSTPLAIPAWPRLLSTSSILSHRRLSLGLSDADPGRVSLYLLYDDGDDGMPYGKAQQQGGASDRLGPSAKGSDRRGCGVAGQRQLGHPRLEAADGGGGAGEDGGGGWWLTWRVEACGVERGGGAGVRLPVPGEVLEAAQRGLYATLRYTGIIARPA